MARVWLLAGIVVLLAGCTDAADPQDPAQYREAHVGGQEYVIEEDSPPAPEGVETKRITGSVATAEDAPVAGAIVTILELNRSRATDATGTFAFTEVPIAFYVLEVVADGFRPAQAVAEPGVEEVAFLLHPDRTARPPLTVPYNGFIQCALEVVIISPSCDSLLTDERVGGPAVFQSDSVALAVVEPGWSTLVVDVVFDDDEHPGLDGLRFTVRGTQDGDALLDYEQYGKFFSRDGPTFRIEPGGEYLEGDRPVPEDAAAFEIEVFPNGHFWHPNEGLCVPFCTLGVGASLDVEFTLYLTTFYGEPAPPGWSFLA